ncbi:hypothetical protein BRC79_11055 [Halobacteriales archaeon QH_8_67_27]|nr:MAG: hypothetical protein BRC79_11055 [Halobacteriales archaeon QH_8_67_27]
MSDASATESESPPGPDGDPESTASSADGAGYDVPDPTAKEFGLRGWGLVLALVLAFLVIPWTIIALPSAQNFIESLPLGWRDAYLVLPFVPALFLGAIGVWTAVANRRQ